MGIIGVLLDRYTYTPVHTSTLAGIYLLLAYNILCIICIIWFMLFVMYTYHKYINFRIKHRNIESKHII